jgi:hypothetical protein
MTFRLTSDQMAAVAMIADNEMALQVLFSGGARSGKTLLALWIIVTRALLAPGSRHLICRDTFNSLKFSICFDTFPKLMQTAFPGVPFELSRTDWIARFPNGSSIYFLGLDTGDATERLLGLEATTIHLNEVSQIKKETRDLVLSRLAQKVIVPSTGRELELVCLNDLNPVGKGHWAYRLWIEKKDPDTKMKLTDAEAAKYVFMRLNPEGNRENLSPAFFDMMASASARHRKRFLDGEWADETPGQMFLETDIDRMRLVPGEPLPTQWQQIVVAIDPSGAAGKEGEQNDAVGIIVAGLGYDRKLYVLQDCTTQGMGPLQWGQVAINAFDRYGANKIVAEVNFGGAMVQATLQACAPGRRIPYQAVTASRGKSQRAEPIAALYADGSVRHAEVFTALEDELLQFSTTLGWTGSDSPNRADACIWALSALFPQAMQTPRLPYQPPPMLRGLLDRADAGWSA